MSWGFRRALRALESFIGCGTGTELHVKSRSGLQNLVRSRFTRSVSRLLQSRQTRMLCVSQNAFRGVSRFGSIDSLPISMNFYSKKQSLGWDSCLNRNFVG